MKKLKIIISIIMVAAVIATICVVSTVSSGASGTGVGLAEWALNAYYSNWSYVYGGCTPGAVDCSGLIYSYAGGYRVGDAQTFNSDWRFSLGSSIPNIHGLGLYQPGHVGVYVGDNMAVDARGDEYGVCYESVWSHGWTQYFKVPGVSYPDTGWVEFNGDYYYYENGEYLADTSRTIDGETYYFASSGKSSTTPSGSASATESTTSNDTTSNDTKADNNTQPKASGSLKVGSTGSEVEKLQQRLKDLGYYNGEVDGNFGVNTEAAFKLFQQTAGLYVDGIAGSDVDVLYSDEAPAYKTEEANTEETVASEKEDLAETGAPAEDANAAVAAEVTAEEATAMKFSTGDYSDEVLKIQNRLVELGYMNDGADGEYGAKTETAVKGFQTANSLEVTGIVEQTTYDKLFSDTAVAAAVKTEDQPAVSEDADITTDDAAPAVAQTANDSSAKTTNTPNTQVEKTTSELSAKSVSAITDSPIFKRGANATNFEFILWLVVMIVVMLIAFAIVYAVEKKKQKAAYRTRRFQ